jgi:hypothetical protein
LFIIGVSNMPRGGRRPGAGRPRGSLGKATIERQLRARQAIKTAREGGALPLDIIEALANGNPHPYTGKPVTPEQFAAAVAAAPYCHPRAVVVAEAKATGPIGIVALPKRQPPELEALMAEWTPPLAVTRKPEA